MSDASRRPRTGAGFRTERLQPWIAALLSGLLHLLVLLIAIHAPPLQMTPPQAADSGSWVQVDFIGDTRDADRDLPAPPSAGAASAQPSDTPTPTPTPPAASRLRTTAVPRADDQLVPDRAAAPAAVASPPPAASAAPPGATAQRRSRAPAANPSATTRRRPEAWGQPPGLVVQELAPQTPGPRRGPAPRRGRGHDASGTEASLELDGYHVYYDLRSETRLRSWQDQGMTELFIPLPGTRRYMVCPLEIALRRDSGKCRPLDQGSPELDAIGDARDVISVLQVYRRGELVWRGPGAYR